MDDELKTIKIRLSSDERMDALKKEKGLSSRSDVLDYLLDMQKTPQELLMEDLKLIKEHLSMMDSQDAYDQVYKLLYPFTQDPLLAKLQLVIDENKEKCAGVLPPGSFNNICSGLGIPKHKRDEYRELVKL